MLQKIARIGLSAALTGSLLAGCQSSPPPAKPAQAAAAIVSAVPVGPSAVNETVPPVPAATSRPPAAPPTKQPPGEQTPFSLINPKQDRQLLQHLEPVLRTELALPKSDWEQLWSEAGSGGGGSIQIYKGSLGYMPRGYALQAAVATRSSDPDTSFGLYLFALSADYSRVQLIGKDTQDPFINLAKFDLSSEGSILHVWSQWPYLAAEVQSDLQWDGSNLLVLRREASDPTAAFYQQVKAYVDKEDIDGLIAYDKHGAAIYPQAYSEYKELPKPILLLAHRKALDAYRNGDAAQAKTYMEFGLRDYESLYVQPDFAMADRDDLERQADDRDAPNKLTLEQLIPIYNDYAFFLAESGDDAAAEPLLRQIVKLDPQRVVAYLNWADVCWNLDKREEARILYNTYLRLLTDKTKAPQRALERAK